MKESHRLKEVSLAGILDEADAIINLTHFKGHGLMGIGGALKNLAVGFASKKGKYCFHYAEKPPNIEFERCNMCGICYNSCPVKAIRTNSTGKPEIINKLCIGCLACVHDCPQRAVKVTLNNEQEELQSRLADMAFAVVEKNSERQTV